MTRPRGSRLVHSVVVTVASVLMASACGSSSTNDPTTSEVRSEDPNDETVSASGLDASLFTDGALIGDLEIVDCTLENGSETSCYELTVGSQPETVETGPFCPTSLDDPEYGTFVWDGDEPGLYGLDREFWELLAAQGYSFAEADGSINVVDPGEGGTQPTGGDACLQATPDASYTLQVLLPVEPELLDTPTDLGTVSQVGIAIDGVTIFGDAPSGTSGAIPALDHCGGHDDPSGYYHWHFGSTSMQTNLDEAGVEVTCEAPQDDEALVGLAYDGFPIYGPLEDGTEPSDLDECNGHVGPTGEFGDTYHYHLSFDSPNLPGCRAGATAVGKLSSPDNPDVQLPDTGGPGGAGAGPPGAGGPPPPGAPDLGEAAPASSGGHCHTIDAQGQPICH